MALLLTIAKKEALAELDSIKSLRLKKGLVTESYWRTFNNVNTRIN